MKVLTDHMKEIILFGQLMSIGTGTFLFVLASLYFGLR